MTAVAVALTAALALAAVLLAPSRSARNVAKLARDLETDPHARERFYRRALLTIPLAVAIYVIVVAIGGESWRDAGISFDAHAGRTALVASGVGLVGALIVNAAIATLFSAVRPDAIRRASEATKVVAPTTRAERRLWPFVALTAGVSEELLYRGLFVVHLHALVPSLDEVLLAALAAVAFGLAHRYQGPYGVLSSGVLGFAFALVAIEVGNVLVVVALHTLWDVVAGFIDRAEPEPAVP